MFRNYFLLNIVLVIILSLLGIRLYYILNTSLSIPVAPNPSIPRKIMKNAQGNKLHIDVKSYDVIVSKNLFHPSRSAQKETPTTIANPVSDNEVPQLFGTVITNEKKLALLEDRSTKKARLYKVNDSISGFTVSQILENKVKLQKGGETIGVGLWQEKKFTNPTRPMTRKKVITNPATKRRRPRRVRRSTPRTIRPSATRSRRR